MHKSQQLSLPEKAAVFAAFLTPIRYYIGGINFTPSDFVWLFVLILGLRNFKIHTVSEREFVLYLAAAGLFIISFVANTVFSNTTMQGFTTILQYSFAFLLMPLILIAFSSQVLVRCIAAYFFCFVLMSMMGILIYILSPDLAKSIGAVSDSGRFTGFMWNSNAYSKIAAICLLIGLWLSVDKFSIEIRVPTLFMVIAFGIIIFGLMFSASKGGIAVAIVGISAFSLIARKWKYIFYTSALIVISAIAVIALLGIPERFMERVIMAALNYNEGGIDNVDIRASVATEAWNLIAASPFFGIGADFFREQSSHQIPAHNTFLLFWVEGGIFSVVCFSALLLVLILSGFQLSLFNKTRLIGAASIGVSAIFIAQMLVSNHVYGRQLMLPLLLFGILAIRYLGQLRRAAHLQTTVSRFSGNMYENPSPHH